MASSNDFEKIWESYQEVVKTKDISIVDYCQRRSAFGRLFELASLKKYQKQQRSAMPLATEGTQEINS